MTQYLTLFSTFNTKYMSLRTSLCRIDESITARGLSVAFVATMAFFVALTAYAQEQGPPKKISYDVSLSPLYQSSVDIDGGGSFSLSSVFLRLKTRRSVSPTTSIGLNLKYDVDDYDFSGTTEFGGAHPWNDVRRFGISIPFFTLFSNNWSLGVSPSADWLQEYGADSGDSLSYGATAFAFKSFARNKSLGLGAGVFRTIDDETRVFPFLAVDWRFNDHWRLANPFEADALGPAGLELIYSFNERWHLSGGGVYRSFRFRLNDEDVAPDGIGENQGIVSFLRLRRVTTSGFDVDFYIGAILNGELELKDSDGDNLSSSDYNTAPYAAITLSLAF